MFLMDMFFVRANKIRMRKALRPQWNYNTILYSAEITDARLFRPYFLMQQPYFIAAGNKE
jgi:hypothetical protein